MFSSCCLGRCDRVWWLWSLLSDPPLPWLLDLRWLPDHSPPHWVSHLDHQEKANRGGWGSGKSRFSFQITPLAATGMLRTSCLPANLCENTKILCVFPEICDFFSTQDLGRNPGVDRMTWDLSKVFFQLYSSFPSILKGFSLDLWYTILEAVPWKLGGVLGTYWNFHNFALLSKRREGEKGKEREDLWDGDCYQRTAGIVWHSFKLKFSLFFSFLSWLFTLIAVTYHWNGLVSIKSWSAPALF